uniref:VWFA domain-containing protein n=1 Tax=Terrapene triunguis TaxID=2587831 RepID=A0A674J9C1_9SAUR
MFNIGPNKVRFGAVQFSHDKRLEFELDEYSKTNDLERGIDNIRQIYGDTHIGEALTFMQPLFKRAREQRAGRVPCYLIVLTDGESHDSVKEPAERLRNETVNIYAIGVKGANEAQLHEIAGSKSRTFFVQEFDSLKNIKNEIMAVCKPIINNAVFFLSFLNLFCVCSTFALKKQGYFYLVSVRASKHCFSFLFYFSQLCNEQDGFSTEEGSPTSSSVLSNLSCCVAIVPM